MLVWLPRFARNYARTSRTHVFRHSLLRCCVDIQSGQIDRYMHRRPIFSSARFARHGDTAQLSGPGFRTGRCGGFNGWQIIRFQPLGRSRSFPGGITYPGSYLLLPSVRQRDSSIPRPNMQRLFGLFRYPQTFHFLLVIWSPNRLLDCPSYLARIAITSLACRQGGRHEET